VESSGSALTLTIEGNRFTLKTPEGKGGGKVVLDLSVRPHRLDLVGKQQTLLCVYAIDKGKLRLCWWGRAMDRQGTLDLLKQDLAGVLRLCPGGRNTLPEKVVELAIRHGIIAVSLSPLGNGGRRPAV
jgi:hypothetical protein